jgi:hypothetical protein
MMDPVAHGTIIVVALEIIVGMVVIQLSANAGTRTISYREVVRLASRQSYLLHFSRHWVF